LLGLRFHEVLSGTYRRMESATNRRLVMRLTTALTPLAGTVTGTIWADGLTKVTHLSGEVRFRPGRRQLSCDIRFTSSEGVLHGCSGDRQAGLRLPVFGGFSGALTGATGQSIGTFVVRLDPRADLVSHLTSLRPARRGSETT